MTANRSETGSGHSANVIAPRARIDDLGARPRTPSGPAVHAPRKQAGYMTAPDPLAETMKKSLPRGGRPYMTFCDVCGHPSRCMRAGARMLLRMRVEFVGALQQPDTAGPQKSDQLFCLWFCQENIDASNCDLFCLQCKHAVPLRRRRVLFESLDAFLIEVGNALEMKRAVGGTACFGSPDGAGPIARPVARQHLLQ